MNTSVAHPQANGLVERANRSLMEGIKTRLGRERAGWVDELPNVLWAHRTSIKQSNGETPFSLTYGSGSVHPGKRESRAIREDKIENKESWALFGRPILGHRSIREWFLQVAITIGG
ncbi:reverse transcriptase domain-containing protein [Tanacetum coccineum]|uniref:Reverse transcriptase domain-containing protein n=1 Tax=Tanacetum coccineum TaxID=301880 RepID=A0ABQ5DWK0_9ASTR